MFSYEPIAYDHPLYRPPSEADNLILQATIGCSFNRCRFCSMYRDKAFRARPFEEIEADIARAAQVWPDTRRIFLADGDALVLGMDTLRRLLDRLNAAFPQLNRVSAYALPRNLLDKSVAELAELKERRLNLLYVGIESGHPEILRRIAKGVTVPKLEEGLAKAREAGQKISATVILGLGGQDLWQEHAQATAALINRVPPTFVSTLQLHLEPREEADFLAHSPGFRFQDDAAILAEQEAFLEALDPPSGVIFRSNHASNALALAGTLPKDKARLLAQIRAARQGMLGLRPAFLRGL